MSYFRVLPVFYFFLVYILGSPGHFFASASVSIKPYRFPGPFNLLPPRSALNPTGIIMLGLICLLGQFLHFDDLHSGSLCLTPDCITLHPIDVRSVPE
ncbi:unnamed protein product [Protopolystoma xenopodis]|uniref:Uncharacterized protein n=1 Tax=Protopolystoma xenopodis TaxID=117903 RepID=A0A3S5CNB4_9PLAT|nr:unnamed protein product [Protopolystoma xenopodis]